MLLCPQATQARRTSLSGSVSPGNLPLGSRSPRAPSPASLPSLGAFHSPPPAPTPSSQHGSPSAASPEGALPSQGLPEANGAPVTAVEGGAEAGAEGMRAGVVALSQRAQTAEAHAAALTAELAGVQVRAANMQRAHSLDYEHSEPVLTPGSTYPWVRGILIRNLF